MDRRALRTHLYISRRDPHHARCAVCDCVLIGYQRIDLHEFLVKRNAVPEDKQDLIFVPENCVLIHRECHENSHEVDRKCLDYVLRFISAAKIADWYWQLTKQFSGLPKGNIKLHQSSDWKLYVRSLL